MTGHKNRYFVYGVLTVALLAFAVTLFIGGTATAQTGNQGDTEDVTGPKAYIIIDGKKTEIAEGATVKEKAPKQDGECELPFMTVRGEGLTDSHRSGQIRIAMNDDCSVTVQKVAFSADALDDPTHDDAGGTEASAKEDGSSKTSHSGHGIGATSHEFRGGARSSLQEPISIDLTRTTAFMHYYDYGNTVGGGHDRNTRCRAFITGWYIISCYYTWSPSGPGSVYVQTDGEFDNYAIPNSENWQSAIFWAWPGSWDFECYHTGDPPGPVHWNCARDRYPY